MDPDQRKKKSGMFRGLVSMSVHMCGLRGGMCCTECHDLTKLSSVKGLRHRAHR